MGFGTADDAGVYQLRDDLAIVQTVDFFTPIVDDPYDFGRIAAANALSDVYAMGGTPVSALNIAAFPVDTLDLQVLECILQGGAQIAREANVAIVGGHTIKDSEPKYGLSVMGTIHPARIVTNSGARPGDVLLITKPLGTGVLATGLKRGAISDSDMRAAVEWMVTLNAAASQAMLDAGVRAATDITGYGLLGHAGELMRASNVSLKIYAKDVPLMPRVLELIGSGAVPGGSRENAATHAGFTSFHDRIDESMRLALSDAQTSGGLLMAVPAQSLQRIQRDLKSQSVFFAQIGEVCAGTGIRVE